MFPPALRAPQYRRYVIGALFSLNAMWAQRTVKAWLAWELTESAAWVGAVAFLYFAPTMISGPIFGALADRSDLRRSALATQTGFLLVGAALLSAEMAGVLDIWLLSALSLIGGIVMSAHHPVRMSLTPRLVPRDALPNAVAISSLNFNLARLIGPVAAGWGIAAGGASAVLLATTLLFLPNFAIIAGLAPRPAEGPPPSRVSLFAAVTEGARFVLRAGVVRTAVVLTGVFALIVRGVLELLPALADGVFSRGAAGLGEMMAAAGGGALVAALYLSSQRGDTGHALPKPALIAAFGGFAATAALGGTPMWAAALALVAAAGFTGTMVGVSLQSVVQLNVSDAQRGVVMSLWTMTGIGSAALGAIAMGGLADLIGLETAIILGAALGAVGAGATLVAHPRSAAA